VQRDIADDLPPRAPPILCLLSFPLRLPLPQLSRNFGLEFGYHLVSPFPEPECHTYLLPTSLPAIRLPSPNPPRFQNRTVPPPVPDWRRTSFEPFFSSDTGPNVDGRLLPFSCAVVVDFLHSPIGSCFSDSTNCSRLRVNLGPAACPINLIFFR